MGISGIKEKWGRRLLGAVVITTALSSCAFLDHVGGFMKRAVGINECHGTVPINHSLGVQTGKMSENGEHVILHTPERSEARMSSRCWGGATQVASNADNADASPVVPEPTELETSAGEIDDKWNISYLGILTDRLDDELVRITVRLDGDVENENVAAYAECAAAQYTLSRGYGFARHVLTSVTQKDSIWTGKSVYWVSETLPRGLITIDAAVAAQSCFENGIPTV